MRYNSFVSYLFADTNILCVMKQIIESTTLTTFFAILANSRFAERRYISIDPKYFKIYRYYNRRILYLNKILKQKDISNMNVYKLYYDKEQHGIKMAVRSHQFLVLIPMIIKLDNSH